MIKKIEMAAINDPNKISNQISERKGVMHGEDQLRIQKSKSSFSRYNCFAILVLNGEGNKEENLKKIKEILYE